MQVPGTYLRTKARIWPGTIPGSFEPGWVEPELIEHRPPEEVRSLIQGGTELHYFTFGECNVLLGHEPQGAGGELRWHITISHNARHPSWDEIKTVRYRLCGPDIVMAMILPQPHFYVDSHPHVFQLWEVEDPARVWEVV